jgi:ABC-type branched-subunit amino acid transport system ATPase component
LAVADRAYVLESGKIVFEDTAAAIATHPTTLTRFLGVH